MISIRNLRVRVGGFQLQDINIDVQSGEYFIVLGPTGAGKTLLLETIAGFHPVLQGSMWINDKEITGLTPEKRGIGIVYQDQVLFPHLSVRGNIAFGLKSLRCPKNEIMTRVNNIAQLWDITDLLPRNPSTLSGGEKQKVALARALVMEPAVLLLDEPLSALDIETKERMQRQLIDIHLRLKLTIIHVSHDFEEAVVLGSRVAVMSDGQIVQVGIPDDVLRRPNSEFVARFALSRNVFSGQAEDAGNDYAVVNIEGTRILAATCLRGAVRISIRPEDILLCREPPQSTMENVFGGTFTDVVDRGTLIHVTVRVPPDFICCATRQAFEALKLSKGSKAWVAFKASSAHAFK